MIYVDIVRTALRELTVNNLAQRRVLYEQLRSGLKSALDDCDPPLDGRDKAIENRLLETTIRRIESDLRAGVDVAAEAYVPEGLEAEQARLYALRVIVRSPPSPVGAAAAADADGSFIAALSLQMRTLSFGAAAQGFQESAFRPATLAAVVLRFVTGMSASQGKLGLIWILIEPLVLIGSTIAAYLMFDQRSVLNMDLIPFAILGVTGWMLVRVSATRTAGCALAGKDLLALPPIRLASIAIGQGSAQFLLYTVAMVGGLSFATAFGHGGAPENWSRLALYWVMLWLFGVAFGVTLAPIFTQWQAAPRFVLLGTRFMSLTSGLAVVSEQLPSDMKAYIVWNPIMHGMQLLRSAYFTQYESDDASFGYFLFSIGTTLIMATVCERILAPRVEPA